MDEDEHRRSPPTIHEYEDIDQTLFDLREDNSIVALIAPKNCDLLLPPSQKWHDENKYKSFFSYERFFGPSYSDSLSMGAAFSGQPFLPVDIVGSQTAIKKILMLPFSATPVSMICHRVGETIYLDNKDFSLQDTQMISDSLQLDHEPNLSLTVNPLPYSSMYEHLIWHGAEIAANSAIVSDELLLTPRPDLPTDRYGFPRQFNSFSYKVIPENSAGFHEKAHYWEFSGTKFLVDIDIPILGLEFPTVSIKFNEGDRPISFLTGLDIFLDKLICNFEFTIVVHHCSGVITDREVFIGHELPVLSDCEFHPDKLKTVAKNIVAFLERNVMQQGHTYWLYKEAHKDELKLYDLTSICPEYARDPQFNPFLAPVVNLLYKIALRLMLASQDYRSDAVSNVINGLLSSAQEIVKRDKLLGYACLIDYLMCGVYVMYSMEDRETKAEEQAKLLEGLDKCANGSENSNTTSAYMKKLESYLNTKRLFDAEFRLEETGSRDVVNTEKPLETRDDHLHFCMHKAVEHARNALNLCDMIEEQRMDAQQITLPFAPDGADDAKAYNELAKRDDPDVTLHFVRQCLRLRIAVAYCVYAMHSITQTGETSGETAQLVSDAIEYCDEICRDSDPPKHFVKIAKMTRTKLYAYFLLFMISRERERRKQAPHEPYNAAFKFIEQRSVVSVRELIDRYETGRIEERIQVLVKAAEKTRLASRIFKEAELNTISKLVSPFVKKVVEGYRSTVAETMYVSERIFLYAVEDANRYFNDEYEKYEASSKSLEDEKAIREKHSLVLTRVKHFDESYDKLIDDSLRLRDPNRFGLDLCMRFNAMFVRKLRLCLNLANYKLEQPRGKKKMNCGIDTAVNRLVDLFTETIAFVDSAEKDPSFTVTEDMRRQLLDTITSYVQFMTNANLDNGNLTSRASYSVSLHRFLKSVKSSSHMAELFDAHQLAQSLITYLSVQMLMMKPALDTSSKSHQLPSFVSLLEDALGSLERVLITQFERIADIQEWKMLLLGMAKQLLPTMKNLPPSVTLSHQLTYIRRLVDAAKGFVVATEMRLAREEANAEGAEKEGQLQKAKEILIEAFTEIQTLLRGALQQFVGKLDLKPVYRASLVTVVKSDISFRELASTVTTALSNVSTELTKLTNMKPR